MPTILITGGTGMIGTRLAQMLTEKGYQVIIYSRDPSGHTSPNANISYAFWDIEKQEIDKTVLAKADHIIHLAGENIASKRWTQKRKEEIINSRTKSSAFLVKSIAEVSNQVKTVISASAIGWYGADNEASLQYGFKEDAPADTGFLGETCRHWEQSIRPVEALGKRLVILRTGLVFNKSGGVLKDYRKPIRFGIAPVMSTGRQMVSWIQIDDLCRIYMHAIENKSLNGVYNAVSPDTVTNRQLVIALAKSMKGNAFIPVHVPAFALRVILGEMSIEVLKSTTVSAEKIRSTGFVFSYPTTQRAIEALS